MKAKAMESNGGVKLIILGLTLILILRRLLRQLKKIEGLLKRILNIKKIKISWNKKNQK